MAVRLALGHQYATGIVVKGPLVPGSDQSVVV